MASPRRKQWRSLILIALLISGMWGFILGKGHEPKLGLDLQGGISVVLAPKAGQAVDAASLEQAVNIIRNRVDALGVAEPDISTQGQNVLIQLPGIKEQQRALRLIGTTAKLRFRPVLEVYPPNAQPPEGVTLPNCADPKTFPQDDPGKDIVLCPRAQTADEPAALKLGPAALEGTDVSGASAQLDPQGQLGWFVSLQLTGEGDRKFADVTGKLACNASGDPKRQLAIVLDRLVESHPQMGDEVECNRGISGGQAQITGNFSERDAKDLALVLRYGALPVELEPSTTTTVSPTLGRESLRNGLLAGAIGIGIVFLYVLLFYRALGLIIWLGLIVHAVFTFAVVILLGQAAGFALSLAGLAGLIVSFGVAADSFIVYFERIKDEVVTGRTVRTAVDRAWPSAKRTIIAADLVTALAAGVLYFLAVGSVRGFALMLGLSTALDLFVAFLYMHPAVWLMSHTRVLSTSRTLGMGQSTPRAPMPEGSGA